MIHGRNRRAESGQALFLIAGAFFALIVMVALVVDGGNAWAQQRVVQNGSDAAANAGAIVMARRFAGATEPVGGWDAEVAAKVAATANANGIVNPVAYYTDICGIPLQADGSAALNGDRTENLAAAVRVGSGALPTSGNTTPDCPNVAVGPPAGVLVLGAKDVQTYFGGVIGLNTMGVSTRATAVTGYLQGLCDASQGTACAVLPVTIPVNAITCDGHNEPIDSGVPWTWFQVYKVPLCSNGPGNVGWIDWTPTEGGIDELEQSILIPDNPAIDLPSWQYVAQTGTGANALKIEDALRTYDGQVVLIPQFDLTCNPGPNDEPDSGEPAINTGPNYGCPPGDLGGNGSNQWYRMPSFAYFELCDTSDPDCAAVGADHGAYTNGNNKPTCDTGNGATSCLIGKFVDILGSGTVGPGVGGGTSSVKAVGVQLIK